MPTLTLLRHAKAAQPVAGESDLARPLTDRGRAAAAAVGRMLALAPPDLALVSAARRTQETWTIASAALPAGPEASIEPQLYLCSAGALAARLAELSPAATNVIVVGHNPCMHEMAMFLAGRSRDAAAVKLRDGFPTAALARFRLDQEGWTELDPATATLERFDTPDRSA